MGRDEGKKCIWENSCKSAAPMLTPTPFWAHVILFTCSLGYSTSGLTFSRMPTALAVCDWCYLVHFNIFFLTLNILVLYFCIFESKSLISCTVFSGTWEISGISWQQLQVCTAEILFCRCFCHQGEQLFGVPRLLNYLIFAKESWLFCRRILLKPPLPWQFFMGD